MGKYEPFDGVVDGIFKTEVLASMLRFAVPRNDGLSWSSFLLYYDFESKVANLENDVKMWSINSGFRKSFLETDKVKNFGVEPFFGAGIGYIALYVRAENEAEGKKFAEKLNYSYDYFIEIGTCITNLWLQDLDLEVKVTDMIIGKELFGNINIGGRLFSVGVNYNIGY